MDGFSWWSAERALATTRFELAVVEWSFGQGWFPAMDKRTSWLSGLGNDIDLRKMATGGQKQRSANCRRVPEAGELNGDDGCCLELLSRSAEVESIAW